MTKKIKFLFLAGGTAGQILLLYPLLLTLVQRGRDLNSAASFDTSALIQVLYVFVSFVLVYSYQSKLNQIEVIYFLKKSPIRHFTYFSLVCALSAFWSPNAFLTIYRSIEVFVFTYIIITLAITLCNSYNVRTVLIWLIYFAFFNLLMGILFRIKLEGMATFRVPFLASRLFFPLFFFIICFYSNNFWTKSFAIILVVLGLSNKIFIGIAVGFFVYLLSYRKMRLGLIIFGISFVFILVLGGLERLLLNTLWFGRESVGIEDASGRELVWSVLWASFLERPFFGYGFVAGETELVSGIFKRGVINAHNSFISALINVGLFGTLFLLRFYLEVGRVINQKLRGKFRAIGLSTLVLVYTVLFAAPGIGGRVYGAWLPSMLLIVFLIVFTRNIGLKDEV